MVDPETELTIYVGITYDPATRRTSHYSSIQSSVKQWINENGRRPVMVSIGRFRTSDEALRAEAVLIAFIPGLVNKAVPSRGTRARMLGIRKSAA